MKFKLIAVLLLCLTCLFGCTNDTPEVDKDEDVTPPPTQPEEVEYIDLEIFVDDDEELRVLQFADLHFGDEDKNIHNGKEEMTYQYMQYLIEVGQPHIIVASGDNIVNTGVNGVVEFIELMESYKTPWVWMFGNHDIENGPYKRIVAQKIYELSLESEYLLYTEDYIDRTLHRYGNFIIEVYNKQSKTLRGGIACIDSGLNDRVNPNINYEPISQGQVDWYVEAINELDSKYEGEGVVPTILFQHMHTPVFYDGYLNAVEYKNNPESQEEYLGEFVIEQFMSSLNISSIEKEGSSDDNGMFDKIVELGSTKGIFVGHTHYHKLQYTYKDVLLGFGPQTGYANNFYGDDAPRSTYQYHLDNDFNITTNDIGQPHLTITDNKITMKLNEIFETNFSLNNIEGDIEVTLSNDNISFTKKDNAILLNALKPGATTVTLKGPYKLEESFVVEVAEEVNYILYDNSGTQVLQSNSLYELIDELFYSNLPLDSYIENLNNEVVFVRNNFTKAVVDTYGINTLFGDNAFTEGYFNGFGSYSSQELLNKGLSLFDQNQVSILDYSNTNNIGFYTRPSNFTVTNTDFSGGYNGSQSPNNTWSGWQASINKSAVTVAQYVSWGGVAKVSDQYVLNYHLNNSVMVPSYNANQPTRADIWLGNSSAGEINRNFGITFNAGTIEDNKDLVDGTVREWDIYMELNYTNGGMASHTPGVRTILGTVGNAVWNKDQNAWIHNFDVKLELVGTNNTVGDVVNFDYEFILTSNGVSQSFLYENEEIILHDSHRFTYGVNYTPDITVNNRKVPDITNGGSWTGLTQGETGKYYQGFKQSSLSFLDGRLRNDAIQVGVYGSDVLSVKKINDQTVFTFRY